MLEIKRKSHTVSIDGTTYELREPSVVEVQGLAKTKEEESLPALIKLIDTLGIPSDVVNSLSLESVEAIANLVMPKKKS